MNDDARTRRLGSQLVGIAGKFRRGRRQGSGRNDDDQRQKTREVAVLGHIPGPICHVTVAHSKAAVNDLVVAGACLRTLV